MKGDFTKKLYRLLMPVIGLSLILSLSGCSQQSGAPAAGAPRQSQAKNVKPVPASVAPITFSIEYPSKLKAIQEVYISSEISGRIASINKDVGANVEKGEVLFTLEATELKSQTRQQILTAEQSVDKAQISYNDAKALYERNEALYQSGAISRQTLTDSEVKLRNAEIELKTARENLGAIRQRLLQSSDSTPDTTVIRSPISGTISIRNVSQGETVTSSTKAFTIIDTSALMAEVGVPDKLVEKLRKGQKIPLKISTQQNQEIDGIIDSVSPAADATSQTYIVKIKVENKGSSLKPGMFARAIIPVESKEKVLTVPNESVKIENGIKYIYVVDNGVVRKKAVNTGLVNEKVTEVLNNLKEGDMVITEGQIFLNDGEKVNIVDGKNESNPSSSGGSSGARGGSGGNRPTEGSRPADNQKGSSK